MGPTWGPPGADRTQVGPMLAPWTLLSGHILILNAESWPIIPDVVKMHSSIWKQYIQSAGFVPGTLSIINSKIGHNWVRYFGTKILPEPILAYCQLHHWGQNLSAILLATATCSIKEMHLKMSSEKCRWFYHGINVLIQLCTASILRLPRAHRVNHSSTLGKIQCPPCDIYMMRNVHFDWFYRYVCTGGHF